MEEIKTGGPAFPCAESENFYRDEGMTLRDYFAAKAMQSLIRIYEPKGQDGCIPDVADTAYGYADAMLEARE